MTATSPSIALRPLGLGQLLDQAIRIYRRNFLKFIGIIAVVQVPLVLIQLILTVLLADANVNMLSQAGSEPGAILTSPGYLGSMGGNLLVSLLSFFLVQGLATAALTRAIADNRLGLASGGVMDSYSRIGNRWMTLIGTLVLWALILTGLFIWMLVPCVGWLTGPGIFMFASLVVGAMIPSIVVLENKGSSAAIRRAWDLVRRRFWWMVGFVVILMLFSQLVVTGPATLLNWGLGTLLGQVDDLAGRMVLTTAISSVTSLLLSLLYLPLQLTALTLAYFDLRVRTEGFDLALQTAGAESAVDMAALTTQAPPPAQDSLVTGAEIGNFAAITIGVIMLYAILLGIIFIFGAGLAMAGGA